MEFSAMEFSLFCSSLAAVLNKFSALFETKSTCFGLPYGTSPRQLCHRQWWLLGCLGNRWAPGRGTAPGQLCPGMGTETWCIYMYVHIHCMNRWFNQWTTTPLAVNSHILHGPTCWKWKSPRSQYMYMYIYACTDLHCVDVCVLNTYMDMYMYLYMQIHK